MKKISVAIIVKNEADIIDRCIECVSLFADEIVIVDTGSTDETKELAVKHPKVKLYDSDHFGSWTHFSEFSFSVAKNEAIAKCTGDWIIWWDADDWIDQENADRIRNLVETTEEPCLYSFKVVYGPMSFEHCRLFKNGHNIAFDNDHSVHEYLNSLGHPNYSRHEIVIEHRPGKKHVPSNERNIAIMEKDYYERGMKDPRTTFYLASSYRECGRHEKAVEFYRKYLEVSKWAEERYFARYYLGQALVVMGNYAEAKKEALRALSEDFRFAEAMCLLGDLELNNKNPHRALAWYMMAKATPDPADSKLFKIPDLYDKYPTMRIADCQKMIGTAEIPVMPEKMQEQIFKPLADAKGSFILSDDFEEAVTAASALAAVAKRTNEKFNVFTENGQAAKVIDGCDGLVLAKADGAVSLILPSTLNGRPREEWYCRAAGFVFDNWQPIVSEAKVISDEVRRVLNVD